jgi:hypothetical protein
MQEFESEGKDPFLLENKFIPKNRTQNLRDRAIMRQDCNNDDENEVKRIMIEIYKHDQIGKYTSCVKHIQN